MNENDATGGWKIGKKKVVYNKRFKVVEYSVKTPSGKTSIYNHVDIGDVSVVVALTSDKEVITVRQFRPTFGKEMISLPAGRVEGKETPLECAKRELREEAGFLADDWRHIGSFAVAPGMQSNRFHIFLAQFLKEGVAALDENEFIEIGKIHIDELLEGIKNNAYDYTSLVLSLLLARFKKLI